MCFYSSHFQQMILNCCVKYLVHKVYSLPVVKRYDTGTHYPIPTSTHGTKIIAFADASHSANSSQLCYLIFVMFGSVTEGNFFHLIVWASYKSR